MTLQVSGTMALYSRAKGMVASARRCKGVARHLSIALHVVHQMLADVEGCKGGKSSAQRVTCSQPLWQRFVLFHPVPHSILVCGAISDSSNILTSNRTLRPSDFAPDMPHAPLQLCLSSSKHWLLPYDAPVIIAEKHTFFFSFLLQAAADFRGTMEEHPLKPRESRAVMTFDAMPQVCPQQHHPRQKGVWQQ